MWKKLIEDKRLAIKLIVLLFLVVIFVIFIFLKMSVDICETWSTTFVQGYIVTLGFITKYLPFSLTEFLAVILIVLALTFLVLLIIDLFKKKFRKAIHKGVNIALMVFTVLTAYQVTAEMMYNRKRLELPLYEEKVTKDKFKAIINYFIDDLNECCNHLEYEANGDIKTPDLNLLNEKVEKEYQNLKSTYLFNFTTKCKPMYLTSFLYTEFHITGVTFIPLAEANVNILNVNSGKGFTAAHELAHTKGAMRENEADLVASYITLHSSDYYLRYSGYTYTIYSLLDLANYTGVKGDYNEVSARIDNRFKNNVNFNRKYWAEHNKASEFANWWNDLYLKISGQKEGTSSYGDSGGYVDPTSREITSFSSYQKLYFEIFYNQK